MEHEELKDIRIEDLEFALNEKALKGKSDEIFRIKSTIKNTIEFLEK